MGGQRRLRRSLDSSKGTAGRALEPSCSFSAFFRARLADSPQARQQGTESPLVNTSGAEQVFRCHRLMLLVKYGQILGPRRTSALQVIGFQSVPELTVEYANYREETIAACLASAPKPVQLKGRLGARYGCRGKMFRASQSADISTSLEAQQRCGVIICQPSRARAGRP